MTILNPENKVEAPSTPEKVEAVKQDPNVTQKPEQILQQKQNENKDLESQEDPNWRAVREARKKDRAEREAAEKKAAEAQAQAEALKAALESVFSKSAPPVHAYQQYYGMQPTYDQPEETEDEKIEKKVNALLAIREEKARQEASQREMQEYPNRLKKDFPDFDHIVNAENLDYIDYHYPEVSRPLQRLNDGYEKWSDIYHAIRKFVPNHASAKKDAIRAEINQQKPKSISSTGITQSGENVRQSWQEVEQRRAARWQEMQNILKGV